MCNYLPIGYNHVPTEVNWSFDIDITESKSHVFFKIYLSMSDFFFFSSKDVFFCTAHLSLLKSRKEMVLILKSTSGNIDALSTGKQSWALTEYACSSILPIEHFIALCWGQNCDIYLWNMYIYPSYHFFLSSVLTQKFGRRDGRRAQKNLGGPESLGASTEVSH